jgi:hypothetical protein
MKGCMNKFCLTLALGACAMPAWAGTDVGVSIAVGQPGFYGRIDVGTVAAPPVLVYPQPVVIAPAPRPVVVQPVYLHVPPGHAKDWGKHCGKYNACAQPVYFVREDWYQQQYVRGQGHGNGQGKGNGNGNGKGKGKGKHGD